LMVGRRVWGRGENHQKKPLREPNRAGDALWGRPRASFAYCRVLLVSSRRRVKHAGRAARGRELPSLLLPWASNRAAPGPSKETTRGRGRRRTVGEGTTHATDAMPFPVEQITSAFRIAVAVWAVLMLLEVEKQPQNSATS